MRPFYPGLIILLLLALLQSTAALGSAPAPDVALIRSQLHQWETRTRELEELKKTIKTMDVMGNANEEDRYSWNPFWRSSQERHLQQLNQLILQAQHLDQQLQNQQPELQQHLENYRAYCSQTLLLSPDKRRLWVEADQWLFERMVAHLNLQEFRTQISPDTDPELYRARFHLLNHHIHELQTTIAYIQRRLKQPTSQDVHLYRQWAAKFTADLVFLTELKHQLQAR